MYLFNSVNHETNWMKGLMTAASWIFFIINTVNGGLYHVSLCEAGSWMVLKKTKTKHKSIVLLDSFKKYIVQYFETIYVCQCTFLNMIQTFEKEYLSRPIFQDTLLMQVQIWWKKNPRNSFFFINFVLQYFGSRDLGTHV